NTANPLAQPALLPDGVHHLAQQILIADTVACRGVARPFHDLTTEALDLVRGHGPEVRIERISRLELLTIDQERVRTCEGVVVLVVIAEERETAVHDIRGAVRVCALET